MGQISWSTQNGICKMTACPSSTSTHFLLRHGQKKNLECLDEKVAYICRLFILFNFFFFFAFLLFISFFSSHRVSIGLVLQFKNFWESIIETGNFYQSLTQISEHFPAYLRLHWAHSPDLGISGKTISSCRTWVQMTPIWAKGDDFRSWTKANTGVNGLILTLYAVIEDPAFFSYTCISNACKERLFRSAIVMSVKTSFKIERSVKVVLW